MNTICRVQVLLSVAVVAIVSACSGNLTPVVTASEFRNIPPISKSVLLLMPEEFARHVYTGGMDKRKVSFELGETTSKLLPTLLDRIFTTVDVREVKGDAAAALSSTSDAAGRDYIAVPRFADTNTEVTSGGMNIQTAVSVEFLAVDRSRTITAAGSGKGSTHIWLHASLQTTAAIALRNALQGLVADINTKRESF
jgi:hypothetical protein